MHHFSGRTLHGVGAAEIGSIGVLRAQRPFLVVVDCIKHNRIELGVLVRSIGVVVASIDRDGASFLILQIIEFHQNLQRVAAEREGQALCGQLVVPAAVTNQRPFRHFGVSCGLQSVSIRSTAHRLLQIALEFVQHHRDRAEETAILALGLHFLSDRRIHSRVQLRDVIAREDANIDVAVALHSVAK